MIIIGSPHTSMGKYVLPYCILSDPKSVEDVLSLKPCLVFDRVRQIRRALARMGS